MSRVDFYVLPENLPVYRFICGIAQKARRQDLSTYVLAPSREDAMSLDDLMWTFRDISFIPHCLADDKDTADVPVIVGWTGCRPEGGQVLINLSGSVPEFAAAFERVVETAAPPERQEARERYRRYRELGFEMHDHTIDGAREYAA